MFKNILLISVLCIIGGAGCIQTRNQSTPPPSSTPQVTLEQSLTALVPAVEKYLDTKIEPPSTRKDEKRFSAFIPYGQEEKNGKLYYYIWAQRETYTVKNGKLQRVNGNASPVVLIIEKSNEVYSRITSHKVPEDGGGYSASLKKLFPAEVIKKMNLTKAEQPKRAELLQKEIQSKAAQYFKTQPDSLDKIEAEKCTNFSFEQYKMDAKDVYTGSALADWDAVYNSSTYPNYELRKKIYTGYIAGEVNFAGHFVVVTWECGKKCQEHAVVDMLTGRIVKTGLTSQYGAEFKLNSLVLVTNPYRSILEPEPNSIATRYYLLSDKGSIPQLNLACNFNDKQVSTPAADSTDATHNQKRYLSREKEECAVMLIQCKSGERVFTDDQGCGCEPGGP